MTSTPKGLKELSLLILTKDDVLSISLEIIINFLVQIIRAI